MTEQPARWSALLSGKNSLLAFTLTGAVSLHALTLYMVSTIQPQLIRILDGFEYYSWTESYFFITTLIGATLVNRVLDTFGARRAYVAACLLFALATLACGLAPSMPVFLLARLVQGLGSGLLASLTYSMVQLVFEKRLWPHTLALIAGSWGLATLLGPALGGIFVFLQQPRMTFFFITALALLFAFISARILPDGIKSAEKATPLPWLQLFLLTVIILAISAISVFDRFIYQAGGAIFAAGLLALLVYVDKHGQSRMLPQGAFSPGSMLFSLYALIILLSFPGIVADTFLTLFLQELHGLSVTLAGYLAVLVSIGWTLGALLNASAGARKLIKLFMLMPVLSFIGLGVLLFIIPAEGASYLFLALAAAALLTVGLASGIIWPHLLAQVLHSAPQKDAGLASASITQMQLFASAFGAALAGVIANFAGFHNPGGKIGLQHSAIALFIFLILAIIATLPAAWRIIRQIRAEI
ncbi:MAG: Major facilitator transporter family protein [Candidatus Tokpelaia hoelldobleri]|uniref:Major facilitator transporter family protein n=1 Tax=Candidatus Tokpelaia hoelldobleri TaxID=1902579 RepID=A0A1U9JUL9_9HYPH|nr:MAG: Major facilitator transporter family protein [Candidatus Tokpelaia hoelldoblerii]